jgi:hypothetical protein
LFSFSSRYRDNENRTREMDDGEIVVYRERRLIPRQEDHVTMQTLVRTPEERIDQISRRALGDPSQFWQLCDANVVMNPHDLLEDPRALVNVPAPLFKVTR